MTEFRCWRHFLNVDSRCLISEKIVDVTSRMMMTKMAETVTNISDNLSPTVTNTFRLKQASADGCWRYT